MAKKKTKKQTKATAPTRPNRGPRTQLTEQEQQENTRYIEADKHFSNKYRFLLFEAKCGVGHHGTGDLELTIRDFEDLEKAKPLIQRSFEEN